MDKSRIVIAGGTGLIGKSLRQYLTEQGYTVELLSRRAGTGRQVWDPERKILDPACLEGAYAVINLSGANIAGWLWTAQRKRLLWSSRLNSTTLLVDTINALRQPPQVFINASAIGLYPDLGPTWQDETAPADNDFLGQLCSAWEQALMPLRADVRKVWLRIGLVLSREGGILPRLRLSLKWHLGIYFGSGGMYYSWIHIDDICHMIGHLLRQPVHGAVNAVAPEPVPMREFMTQLATYHRPALLFSVPTWILRLALGEFAQVVLKGARIQCKRAEDSGFNFQHAKLTGALADLFHRKN